MPTPHKILVVDDEKALLRVSVRIMQSAGYEVFQAENGHECLEIIKTNPPDLILLDVGLPDINGFEVCKRIKTDPVSSHIYIAMISGRFTASESQADGLDAGADAFLARPIAKRELLSRVKALFRLKDMENEIKHQKDELTEINSRLMLEITRRKETADALQEKEAIFRGIFEQAAVGIVRTDLDGHFLQANSRFCDIIGYRLEDLNDLSLFSIIHPEDLANEKHQIEALLAGEKKSYSLVKRFVPKTGPPIWSQTTVSLVRARTGTPKYFVAIVEDFSEHKQNKDQLIQRTRDLGERVKELNCLVGISRLRDLPDLSLDNLLKAIVELIPPAWRYPEIACARIVIGRKKYQTDNFKISKWHQQSTIVVQKKAIGALEVGYIAEPPGNHDDPFLAEEHTLTEAITERIGHIFENMRAHEALEHEYQVNEALSDLYMPLIEVSSSISEIGATILYQAQRLTGSAYGFVSSIDAETSDNIGHALEESEIKQCAIPGAQFPLVLKRNADGTYNGLWGHALNTHKPFFTNAPATHKSSAGLPDGHVSIKCLLSVPVLLERELVGQIALANKPTHYTTKDLAAIGRLADYYALAIQRYRTEEALKKAHDNLEQNVKHRTEELLLANRELKKMHDQMANAHHHRKMLAKELIGLIEKDRDQIAAELHDQVGQTLTSLKMNLETIYDLARASGTEFRDPIKAAGEKTIQIIKDIKSISKGLKPSMIDALGLVPSLRELFGEIEKDTRIKVNFFHRNIPKRFEQQKELALYRLAQEAMANIIKHSQAQTVYVNLILKNKMLSLTVEDDGIGFDAQKILDSSVSTGSLGVSIMRERATQLDGLFDIESQNGQGTHLMAEIPL
jgi:PAS domain S-box-containing protein